ncbi:MAG: EamA family transporter [Sedimenticola sp.]|jgi:drug/metabolite transporter (DMT)-like permease|nr:MAG: EamA family transporter [Sedimenticola sp.]
MPPQQKAFYFAITTVFLWSTVATAFKLSLLHLSPLQLLFYANLASTLTLLLLLLFEGRIGQLRSLRWPQFRRGFLLGLLNPLLYYLVLFKAYDLLPAQEAQPINYTWAITLSLLSVPLLGHRLTGKELLSILVSYAGVVVIVTHGEPFSLTFSSLPGVALALVSTLIWAVYWIYSTRGSLDPVIALFLNFATALPLVALLVWATSTFYPLDFRGIAAAVYVGVIEMGIAFVLWLKAMRLTSSTVKIATLIYFAPFLSLILIHFILGETIRWSSVAGLVLIVAGNLIPRWRMPVTQNQG